MHEQPVLAYRGADNRKVAEVVTQLSSGLDFKVASTCVFLRKGAAINYFTRLDRVASNGQSP